MGWKGKIWVMDGRVQVRRVEGGEVEEREVSVATSEKIIDGGRAVMKVVACF